MQSDDLHGHLEFGRSLTSAALVGIGIMAAVDEIVFHQILAWHHFYDLATPAMALLSDGLLHSAELLILVAGFFMLGNLLQRGALVRVRATAGFLLGAGGFQVFDGIVDHKVLRVHQIRYGVENLWVYDLAWNAAGVALLVIGLEVYRRSRARAQAGAASD